MAKLTIDGKDVEVADGLTLIQACEEAGVEIPRFCYHDRLSIAGNCRMCLVEEKDNPKLIASCAMQAADGMAILTDSPKVHEARKGVMEFLLANHPLDCPICDQGGECDLQDQAMAYGFDRGRFDEDKRAVEDKDMGPLIATDMTRCIHCTRCVRFATEIAGVPELGAFGRGEDMEIMPYLERTVMSELSGNMIDLCPVGALTSKPFAFTARVWELRRTPSIDVMDAVGSAIRLDSRGREIMRILPILNEAVNEEWISDKARFVYDGLRKQRLDRPYQRNAAGRLEPVTWEEVLPAIADKMRAASPKKIGAIAGGLACSESIWALKDLMTALGSPNLDCRAASHWTPPAERGGWLFNTTIAGIAEADAILLIGANPRLEAAIVNARIFARWSAADIPIGLIGEKSEQPYRYLHIGDDPSLLGSAFMAELEAAQKPMIILGQGALAHGSAQAIYDQALALAERVGAIGADWNGFNLLHAHAASAGGFDIGFLPQPGGAHVDAMLGGQMDVLFLLHLDEADLSRLDKSCVIYQGSHGDRGAEIADFILPGSAWTEKNTLWVNMEGRVQEARRAIFPPGQARPDWAIIRALMSILDINVPYDDLDSLRLHMAQHMPHFAHIGEIAADIPMPKVKGGAGGSAIKNDPFPVLLSDFYLSNPIARASSIMAACSRAQRAGQAKTAKEKAPKEKVIADGS